MRSMKLLPHMIAVPVLCASLLGVAAAQSPRATTVTIALPAMNVPNGGFAVDDHHLVYTLPDPPIHANNPNAPFTNFYTRVFAVDLVAGSHLVATTPRLLFTAARGAILTPWSIAGQWLVYMQYPASDPAGSWTLAVRNLRTGRSTILDTPTQEGVPSLAAQAASDGRTVVWQSWTVHHGQTTSVIRAYDLVTGHRRLLIEGGGMTTWSYAWPDVSGRWVVFEKETPDRQSPHGQILLDNLDTGRVQALTPAAAANSEPAISGDLVIWKNTWRFAAGHGVGVYNVRTGAQVTLAGANVEQPKVTFGRYVVFPTGNPFHVQLYEVQTHVSTTLAGPRPDGYQPGNVVLVGGHAVAFILAKFTTTTKPFPTRLVVTQLP